MRLLARKIFILLFSLTPLTGFCLGELEGDAALFFDETCVNYRDDYSELQRFLEGIGAKKLDPEVVKEVMPTNTAGGQTDAYVFQKGLINKIVAFNSVGCSMLIMKPGFDGEAVRNHFVSFYGLGNPRFKEERSFVLNEAYGTNEGTLKGHLLFFIAGTIPSMDSKTYVLSLVTPEGMKLVQQ